MKRIVIIGGGIAGLSAGIFAQKNGFESIVLEKNDTVGGECTGWDRQGYHIDGCIHWLIGTKQGTPMHDLWKSIGALEGIRIFDPETFLTFESREKSVHFYRDLERLKSSWIKISPQDEYAIGALCKDIKTLHAFEVPVAKPLDLMGPIEKIKSMLSMKEAGLILQKYGKISLRQYAKRFKDAALREALASFLPEGYSASSILFALAAFTKGQASIPYKGSRAFSLRIAERYLGFGGVIKTQCQAAGLDIHDGKAEQVICEDGRTFSADYVIAACDARELYERLLKGQYPDSAFQKRFQNEKDYPLASQIQIAIGYEGLMDDIPRRLSFPISSLTINQKVKERLEMTHYQHETGFAPEGHSIIMVCINQFDTDYAYWEHIAKDPQSYKQEKKRIGEAVLGAIAARFPAMHKRLKVLDIATPKTYARYCNAYRGAFMAFLPTVHGKPMDHPGRIKGLKNVFLSGQWLQPPGGLPVAAVTGKDTIMRICRQEKKDFAGI